MQVTQHKMKKGCVSFLHGNVNQSQHAFSAASLLSAMEWFSKLFGRAGKAKREYPNLTRGKDPLELWNKTGELGDGAFGKVYKVSLLKRLCMGL